MRTKKHMWIGAAVGMLILILDTRTAIEAAKNGVLLCTQTLIPSLFPFFFFSSLLTGALVGKRSKTLYLLERLIRIPHGTGSLMIIGFLGGYPTGAQCVRQAYDRGQLSRNDAVRMTAFCNNAGPSFLFGIIAPFFPESRYAWILWMIHIFSAMTVSVFIPGEVGKCETIEKATQITLPEALERSIRNMASVCGWVVMFRLILSFCGRWFLWFLPISAQIVLNGIMELTNGCLLLEQLDNITLRFLTASLLIGFGGFCVMLQTKSVIRDFPLTPYLVGKLIQSGFSLLYALNWLVLIERSCQISVALILAADFVAVFIMMLGREGAKIVVAFRQNMVYNRCNVQK